MQSDTTQKSDVPLRFTVCSYNVWTWTRWPERRDALSAFATSHCPDIFCAQELQAESVETIESALNGTHDRVQSPEEGWTCEGNIWWNRNLFAAEEHGAVDVGILEEHRRLFWVRLKSIWSGHTMLVSTAHWTWSGHEISVATEKNVRLPQARATVAALDSMRADNEPQLFMGDLNDSGAPIDVLRSAGFVDCFAALGRYPNATYPARPTAQGPDQTLDWMFARGGLRAKTSEVVDFWLDDIAASDHKPVLATYEFVPSKN
jgi:endonuclease/exonuclease/phosphatase (EEP) superfamily protein YafD